MVIHLHDFVLINSFVLTLDNLPMLFENNWLEFQLEHERM